MHSKCLNGELLRTTRNMHRTLFLEALIAFVALITFSNTASAVLDTEPERIPRTLVVISKTLAYRTRPS